MKVILRADIPSLGHQGEIKDVSPGYARNYLVPRELVWEANDKNKKLWEKERQKYEKQKEQVIAQARELAEKIEKISVTITVKVGESGKLFGSVTNSIIAEALEAQGFTVDKHNVILADPIKEVGAYTVDVRIHPDVTAKAKVWIVEEKAEEKAAE